MTIFDLKTLAKVGEPTAGKNPDAVCYEPKTKRVFAINHTGGDATAIDAKTGEVLKTFPVGASGRILPGGWRRQGVRQYRRLQRSGGDRRGQE